MEITLKIVDESESELWDKSVQSSSYGTLFHTWKWLKIVENHSESKLYPFLAYQGNTILGLYPIFIIKKFFINMAFSPPPKAYLMHLGPLILDENLKQDKKENIFINVQKEIDRFLFSDLKCKYSNISTSPGIFDCRPFLWNGYHVLPRYTYRINLSKGINHVWEQFDRKLRVDLNRASREGLIVKEGTKSDLEFIHESVYQRYKDQGLRLAHKSNYLLDLYKEFYPKDMKVFIAYYKGERVRGMVSLLYKDVMYLWEGVSKIDLKGISPNDFIQWEAIKWACNNNFNYYDNMGGNNPRIRTFKSKYNPDLIIRFTSVRYSSIFYKLLFTFYTDILPEISSRFKMFKMSMNGKNREVKQENTEKNIEENKQKQENTEKNTEENQQKQLKNEEN